MKTGYAEIYYIFGILAAAKQPIGREKLRHSVSCRGSKFTVIFKMLLDKEFLKCLPPNHFIVSDTGKELLNNWQTLLMNLGLGDELSRFI